MLSLRANRSATYDADPQTSELQCMTWHGDVQTIKGGTALIIHGMVQDFLDLILTGCDTLRQG